MCTTSLALFDGGGTSYVEGVGRASLDLVAAGEGDRDPGEGLVEVVEILPVRTHECLGDARVVDGGLVDRDEAAVEVVGDVAGTPDDGLGDHPGPCRGHPPLHHAGPHPRQAVPGRRASRISSDPAVVVRPTAAA